MILILAVVFTVAAVVTIVELARAPQAIETADGFHAVAADTESAHRDVREPSLGSVVAS